ncbi:MFS transporter [Pedobacter duraquae]|uniref:MFS transporter n=1 Tax=Pedobacter duraquae TaxID=425511 RepID=A0A4R6ILB5_9SPHI|nr:MFS transporter [Pedobacter duraquae]TDO22867.1 MFS transporter [Pedobacter duraquae]
MNLDSSVIKSWVPSWFMRIVIFLVILPSLGLFGLSTASGSGASGYYGAEPADVQYSMIVFYAAVASFFALERRFFSFIAIKPYLLISSLLQIITSYICYTTHNYQVLLLFRFIQGMANCASTTICITLIFGQLKTERAREIGYSVFYGMLLCIAQFTTLVTAPLLDAFDFNALYKAVIFLYVPGTVILFFLLNNVRIEKKIPLYQLDWASFLIYAVALCLLGYVLVYGQQYEWFSDPRITYSSIGVIFLLLTHVLRQKGLKRAYLDLSVFKYKKFALGALLIFILYICRGAMGVTTTYLVTILGMDPIHIGYLYTANIAGVILSILISSRMVLMQRPMRLIWIVGFLFLLIFHVWMYNLFVPQADATTYILPLFIQGLGAGTLMTPIILFMISAVPAHLGGTASATGVFFRFAGFCSSIAVINYFSITKQSEHLIRFQEQLSTSNGLATQRISGYKQLLVSRGIAPDQASRLANGLLSKSVHVQTQLRYAMDYYQLISWVIIATILLIALYPAVNRTVINLRGNQPSPASF